MGKSSPTAPPETEFKPVPPADGLTLRRPDMVKQDNCPTCKAFVIRGVTSTGTPVALEPASKARRWLLTQNGINGKFWANPAVASGWTGHRCPPQPSPEEVNRAIKAEKLAKALFASGIHSSEMAITADAKWEAAAGYAGTTNPSETTRAIARGLLERIENGEN